MKKAVVFLIVFSAGYLWGVQAGVLVGLLGMWLWSSFNPFGPAAIPLMAAQMIGAAVGGIVGALFRRQRYHTVDRITSLQLMVVSVLCTAAFYLPVNTVDAWLYQPFWPRFIGGLPWAAISLVSNAVIFPLLFGVVVRLYDREGNLE